MGVWFVKMDAALTLDDSAVIMWSSDRTLWVMYDVLIRFLESPLNNFTTASLLEDNGPFVIGLDFSEVIVLVLIPSGTSLPTDDIFGDSTISWKVFNELSVCDFSDEWSNLSSQSGQKAAFILLQNATRFGNLPGGRKQ